jgi:hypothetical protein
VIEHNNLNSTALVYELDPDSSIDKNVNVIGWNIKGFSTLVEDHSFSDNNMSNFSFELTVERPFYSSFAKNVLPLIIITLIALLTFFISPANNARIGFAVSSLLTVSALHISLLSALPPTGYLTLSDGMMLIVYIIFFYILAVSVWLMKLIDQKRVDDAAKFNSDAWKMLSVLIFLMIMALFVIF